MHVAAEGGAAVSGKAIRSMISVAAPKIAGAPNPSGGGYRFSREEIDQVIAEWEDLHASLTDDYQRAQDMALVQPPGAEPASQDFTAYANPSGRAFMEATQKMMEYVQQYIEALRNARDGITAREDQSQEDINKVGSGVMEV
ncbi:hypothetical protein [Saccharomonospora viridis]|mgnify:CR=1 FL=1|jgi:hypothetical protein|uniref:PE family protein n=2 Tax=Saccharomonospora viridis TaxID=1852 RepID=C7MS29_SACVD|nr:hypothetical protein [Saccharomonospora viridis]ACU98885.1 hypothetical protein Svir_39430 [Saccharomonospora viridis DSM 43017]KHF44684.1 hypothetical protein MINT15_15660 [Saccharomonospora viridis]SFP22835.1 hypothetical protein SAMN02982918_1766 [Saccharomonospora viridis]